MAIDTINEKLSLLEYLEPYQPGVPISADGLDQADNQQLLWEYPGLLWAPPAVGGSPRNLLVLGVGG